MPVPKPRNIGDIYRIADYPTYGQSCYGVAFPAEKYAYWALLMQDGDSYAWSGAQRRWVIDAGPHAVLHTGKQTLVRRNEWPKETS